MSKIQSIFFVLLFSLWAPNVYGYGACEVNSNGEIETDDSGFVDCVADTGEQLLQTQYLAICQNLPTVSNYQEQCEEIFDQPAGKAITLSKGSAFDLLDGLAISLPEGVYTHAVVRIDSLIKMKGEYLFDKPLLGGAGGIGKRCWSATTGTAGTYSDSQDYIGYSSLNQLATQCGPEPNPEFTSQDYNAFSGPGGYANSITGRSSPTGPYDLYTLATPNTLSSTNAPLNGEHLLGIQKFNDDVIITADLKSIDFGFKLTGMFHLQSNWQSLSEAGDNPGKTSGGGGPELPVQCIKDQTKGKACFKYVIPTGFEFSVSYE